MMADDFVRVCSVDEIPDPGKRVFEIDDQFVLVVHLDRQWYALDDRCTHDGGPLGEGRFDGLCIVCPRHGAKFDLQTGAAMTMPAVTATTRHDIKVEQGSVFVRLRDR